MEQALYATSLRQLRKIDPGYSRVYFGAEFCQWRLPSPQAVLRAYSAATEAGLSFTLLTPWVTEPGLRRLRRVLEALHNAPLHPPLSLRGGMGGVTEVIVNDFGVLTLIGKDYPMFTPVLGRLLIKQKRCPRVPGIIDGLPEAGREVYLHTSVEDPVTAKFLRGLGVRRAEMDNPLQGLSLDLKSLRMKGSVYTPYAYVTTTRHCPASFDGDGWQAFTGCRIKGCMANVLRLKNPAHEAHLLMRGNTQFVENPTLPRGLAGMGIDRIVVMEDLP